MALQGACASSLHIFMHLKACFWGKARTSCEGFRFFPELWGYKPLAE